MRDLAALSSVAAPPREPIAPTEPEARPVAAAPVWWRRESVWIWGALAAIVLMAVLLRIPRLDTVPPGLFHDEAFYAFDAREALQTDYHPLYFERNTGGREPLYIYLAAGLMGLLGPTVLTLRLLSALLGIITVVVTFFLGRRLYSPGAGLIAAGLLAVLPWHVHISRDGFRAIILPLFTGLAWWLLWRAWETRRLRDAVIAGVASGLVFYTYMASRVFWIAVALWLGYLALLHFRRTPWRAMAAAIAAMAVVMLPLSIYYYFHQDIFFFRLNQVAPSQPTSFLGSALGEGLPRILGMFSLAGDANGRHNVAGRPVFDPVVSVFFYAGVAMCLWRWRDPRSIALLVWTGIMLAPSLVTEEAPHYLRAIGALPAIVVFPALAIAALIRRIPRRRRAIGWVATAAGIAAVGGITAYYYYGVFADSAEAYDWYGVPLTQACRAANEIPAEDSIIFSASIYRHATCRFLALNEPSFTWVEGDKSIVFPETVGTRAHFISVANEGEMDEAFRRLLRDRGAEVVEGPAGPRGAAYTDFRFDNAAYRRLRASLAPPRPLDVRFGDRIAVRGYGFEPNPTNAILYLYWDVLRPSEYGLDRTTAMSVRIYDQYDHLWAQQDALGYVDPAWRPGDLVISRFPLRMPADAPAGPYRFEVMAYQRGTQVKAPVIGAPTGPGDRLILPDFRWQAGRPAGAEKLSKPDRAIDGIVGPGLRLRGIDAPASLQAGAKLDTVWHWLAEEGFDPAANARIRVTLRPVDRPDRPPLEWTVEPADGYPTSEWRAGQAVRARHLFPMPQHVEGGSYALSVAAVSDTGQASVPVSIGNVAIEGRVTRFELPAIDRAVGAEFPGVGRLAGYTLDPATVIAGQTVTATLVWQAAGPTDVPLTTFVHLLDAAGKVVAQHDGPPGGGQVPTTNWAPGEAIEDRHPIALPAGLAPGDYRIEIGVYDYRTGERRRTVAGAAEIIPGALRVAGG